MNDRKQEALNLLNKFATEKFWVLPEHYDNPWLVALINSANEGDVSTLRQLLGSQPIAAEIDKKFVNTQIDEISQELKELENDADRINRTSSFKKNLDDKLGSLHETGYIQASKPFIISSHKKEPHIEATPTLPTENLAQGTDIIKAALAKDKEFKLLNNAIQLAASGGHMEIIKELLSVAEDLPSHDTNSYFEKGISYALAIAANEGHQDVAKILWDFISRDFNPTKQIDIIIDLKADPRVSNKPEVVAILDKFLTRANRNGNFKA